MSKCPNNPSGPHDYFQVEGIRYVYTAPEGYVIPKGTVVVCRQCGDRIEIALYGESTS